MHAAATDATTPELSRCDCLHHVCWLPLPGQLPKLHASDVALERSCVDAALWSSPWPRLAWAACEPGGNLQLSFLQLIA
jgi:hypothetical protein